MFGTKGAFPSIHRVLLCGQCQCTEPLYQAPRGPAVVSSYIEESRRKERGDVEG